MDTYSQDELRSPRQQGLQAMGELDRSLSQSPYSQSPKDPGSHNRVGVHPLGRQNIPRHTNGITRKLSIMLLVPETINSPRFFPCIQTTRFTWRRKYGSLPLNLPEKKSIKGPFRRPRSRKTILPRIQIFQRLECLGLKASGSAGQQKIRSQSPMTSLGKPI
jgi:hypothetical protein